jgi:hypothetical protein
MERTPEEARRRRVGLAVPVGDELVELAGHISQRDSVFA